MHVEGTGVMEDPNIEKGIIYETNSLAQVQKQALIFFNSFNSKETIKNGWARHHFDLYVNSLSKKGERLYKEYQEKRNIELSNQPAINIDDYNVIKQNGMTYLFKNYPIKKKNSIKNLMILVKWVFLIPTK